MGERSSEERGDGTRSGDERDTGERSIDFWDASSRPPPTADRRNVLKWSGLSLVGAGAMAGRTRGLAAPSWHARTSGPSDGSASDRAAQPNTLTVTKEGTRRGLAAFAVTVSGDVFQTDTSEAIVRGRSAIDWVGPNAGTDTLSFTGEITQFVLKGRARVRLNGEPVDPAALGTGGDGGSGGGSGTLPNTLTVRKAGTREGLGAFAVRVSGDLERTRSSEAVVRGSTAVDWVGPHSGVDELRFSGQITQFLFKGRATVEVNGEAVPPWSLGSPESGLARVGPQSEIHVRPGATVFFEVAPGPDVDPYDVRFESQGYTMYGEGIPFSSSYGDVTGNLEFQYGYESPGTYTPTIDSGTGDRIRWTVRVDDDGAVPPTGEVVNVRPVSSSGGDDLVELTVRARTRTRHGHLNRVIWWLGMTDDVLDVTTVSGARTTARLLLRRRDYEEYPVSFWVVADQGVISDYVAVPMP